MNRNRTTLLVVVLGVVLLVVLWYMFLFKPKADELGEINTEIESTQAQQDDLRLQLEQLRELRAASASIESTLAAYETLIPSSPDLPALLRQLQSAATDSGMTLESVAPSDPSPLDADEAPDGIDDLQSISVAVELSGGYFQLVDFLRRVADPVIVGRVVLVDGLDMGLDEYPTLTVGLTTRVFTTSSPASPEDAPTSDPTPSPTDTGSPEATETTPEPTTTEVPS